jgi:putative membrane protein
MWFLKLKLAIATAASYCGEALVHGQGADDGSLNWTLLAWILPITLACLGYGIGARRLRRSAAAGGDFDRSRVASFAAGIAVLVLALFSPVEALSGQLFSAHMLQHILLMMVAPPLLVWGRPLRAFHSALAPAWQDALHRASAAIRFDRLAAFVMHPLTVFVLFCGAFIFWHLPLVYDLGMRSAAAHIAEQYSFLLAALAFWTIIIEPSGRRRLDYGATLLFLVVTVIVSDLPGALMVLAPRPLYPIHAEGAAAWGMTPMQDQQLAGLIMWIPAGAIYVAAAIWLFVRLLDQAEFRATKLSRYTVGMIALALLPLLGGCDGSAKGDTELSSAERGARIISRVGCGTCHTIPGIDGANGLVGPPLDRMGARTYVAGVLRNTPENMVAWLRDPQSVVPNNAMPDVGLSEAEAHDVAAYLRDLK